MRTSMRAVLIGSFAAIALAACGSDTKSPAPAATTPASGTEAMMTPTTEAMMTPTTEAMMTETTGG